jgi:SAM-dependent methyltransferase
MLLEMINGRDDSMLDEIRLFYDERHERLERIRRRHRYFFEYLARIIKTRVSSGLRVLEIGCGSGDLLAALEPSLGVGVDASARVIESARGHHSGSSLRFIHADATEPVVLAGLPAPFDAIVLVNVVTQLGDVQRAIERLHPLCHARTRLLVYSYSRLWQPILRLAEIFHMRERQPVDSWLPPEEVVNMLTLADFEVVREDRQIIFPLGVPLVSEFLNRFVGHLPVVSALSLMYGVIARPAPHRFAQARSSSPSVSVVIPCRNESGHIRPLIERLPDLGPGSEFIFVEGNSEDDTEAEIRRAIDAHPERPLRLIKQTGRGKGDAVRLGFADARGEALVILDSDMGVAPEDVPLFVQALARGKAELVNGSRLVYPMEGRAMRFLNLLANKFFALFFSWVLGQLVRDTLCGTKALYRSDYEAIARARSYFGDFDPFGDFDLLFGAARLNLRIRDLAVRYHARRYGKTNISRFRHGWLLLRMSLFAARKLKFT